MGGAEETSGIDEWEVVFYGYVQVRSRPDLSADVVGEKMVGTIVVGAREGDWVKLVHEPGFMLVQRGDEKLLQSLSASVADPLEGTKKFLAATQQSVPDAGAGAVPGVEQLGAAAELPGPTPGLPSRPGTAEERPCSPEYEVAKRNMEQLLWQTLPEEERLKAEQLGTTTRTAVEADGERPPPETYPLLPMAGEDLFCQAPSVAARTTYTLEPMAPPAGSASASAQAGEGPGISEELPAGGGRMPFAPAAASTPLLSRAPTMNEAGSDSNEAPAAARVATVRIVSARGLDGAPRLEPYCVCEAVGGSRARFRTRPAPGTPEPVWDHEEEIEYHEGDCLKFTVCGQEGAAADGGVLGVAALTSAELAGDFAGELQLREPKARNRAAYIRVNVRISPRIGAPAPAASFASSLGAGAAVGRSSSGLREEARASGSRAHAASAAPSAPILSGGSTLSPQEGHAGSDDPRSAPAVSRSATVPDRLAASGDLRSAPAASRSATAQGTLTVSEFVRSASALPRGAAVHENPAAGGGLHAARPASRGTAVHEKLTVGGDLRSAPAISRSATEPDKRTVEGAPHSAPAASRSATVHGCFAVAEGSHAAPSVSRSVTPGDRDPAGKAAHPGPALSRAATLKEAIPVSDDRPGEKDQAQLRVADGQTVSDHEDACELTFTDIPFEGLDQGAFKKELLSGFRSVGASESTLRRLRINLRSGSTIAEVRGPCTAVTDIRALPLTSVEVMGCSPKLTAGFSSVRGAPAAQPPPLRVKIVGARDLKDTDWFAGGSDAYVVCEIPGKPASKFRTAVCKGKDPVWNHEAEIAGYAVGDSLSFTVWDDDTFKDDVLGTAVLSSGDFHPAGFEGDLQIDSRKGHKSHLSVRIEAAPARAADAGAPPAADEHAPARAEAKEPDEEARTGKERSSAGADPAAAGRAKEEQLVQEVVAGWKAKNGDGTPGGAQARKSKKIVISVQHVQTRTPLTQVTLQSESPARFLARSILEKVSLPVFPRLFYGGMELDGNTTLDAAGISDDATVFAEVCRAVVTVSRDCTARVWNVDTGKCELALEGHGGPVNFASFAPDHRSLVTASDDASAKVWRIETGSCKLTFRGHSDAVYSAHFSPDCLYVVTASADGTGRIWSVRTTNCKHVLRGHDCSVLWASFAPDGTRVTTTAQDGSFKIWNARTGVCERTMRDQMPVYLSSFTSDGKSFVTACGNHTATVCNVESGACECTLEGHTDLVLSASFAPPVLMKDGTINAALTPKGVKSKISFK